MHCVLGLLFKTSVCGVFGTPEVAARFRQTEVLMFDFGAVYSAKRKSEGSEWFQSDLRVL